MKILLATFEYPPYPGGVGRYCAEVAASAQELGHDVEVFAPDFAGVDGAITERVQVHRFPGQVFSAKQLPSLVFRMRSVLTARRYDVLHVADWPMLLPLSWIGASRRTQTIMTFHGTDAIVLGRSRLARWTRARAAAARLRRICSNSAFTLSLCERELGLPQSVERRVTYLGAGQYWFDPPTDEERRTVRQLCGAASTDKIVLTVARLDERKGHLRAMRAIGALPRDRRSNVCYLAIGKVVDPAFARALENEAVRLGIRSAFVGGQSDAIVRAAYAEADAFLLAAEPSPERVEGFGLVFVEAAAQGLPAVSTATHAIPEVVLHEKTGLLVDPAEPEALTRALEEVVWHGGRARFGAACLAHAKTFTWLRCAGLTYEGLDLGPRS